MKLVIDMDCTLYPFAILEALALLYPERPKSTYEDMYRWAWYDTTYTKSEFYAAVDYAHGRQLHTQPYKDAAHWVNRMGKHVPVIVASHRSNSHMPVTLQWLVEHKIRHDGLYCNYTNKDSLFRESDLVIDDCMVTIRLALDKGCVVGTLVHPWNKRMAELNALCTGLTWAELGPKVYEIVKWEHRK